MGHIATRFLKFFARRKLLSIVILYVLLGFLLASLFFFRYPINTLFSNFYAEDVQYSQNILYQGFPKALINPFNGYLVVGIYLLHGFAWALNYLFSTGEFITQPFFISIVSYLFLGFVAALPVLLLHRLLHPIALAWLVLATLFVPLPIMDYGIIGTTANHKFLFLYLAALLVIYRHHLLLKSPKWKFVLTDSLLLLCCATNMIAVVVVPFLLVRYLPHNRHRLWNHLSLVWNRPGFKSLSLAILLILILFIFTFKGGVTTIGSFYDNPYEWAKTVELFFGRTILFGFLYERYYLLNNLLASIIAITLLASTLYIVWKKFRIEVALLLSSAVLATILLLKGRPGISSLYSNYGNGAYDQYFFTQNILLYAAVAFSFTIFLNKQSIPTWIRWMLIITPFLMFIQLPSTGSWGVNNAMAIRQGTIQENIYLACTTNAQYPVVPVYPITVFKIKDIERTKLCTRSSTQAAAQQETLRLTPNNEGIRIYKPGAHDIFTQTFASTRNGLKGVAIEVVTYGDALRDSYEFKLMDETCATTLRTVRINKMLAYDNSYIPINFWPISDSSQKTYCFTVSAIRPPSYDFALNLTADYVYGKGRLLLNGAQSPKTLVFTLTYGLW